MEDYHLLEGIKEHHPEWLVYTWDDYKWLLNAFFKGAKVGPNVQKGVTLR